MTSEAKKKLAVGDIVKRRTRAKVVVWLGSATSGCHGQQSLRDLRGRLPEIPGWDLPEDTEVEIEIRVKIVKLGKKPSKKCENPWPAHRCDR
jgi:hypothetical protein